jgi:hypothetical protein
MRLITICSILLFTTRFANAQTDYNVSLIQKDLLPRAVAVVRNLDLRIEVKDLNNVIYRYKTATTVLNKNGDDEAALYLWYNKSRQIKNIKGVVYDEFSKPIGKIAEKDFKDVSAAQDFSLFEDSRMKIFRPAVNTYPYTVEYEFEIQAKHTMYFPDWFPKRSAEVSVEHSQFTFSSDPAFGIRFKETNYKGDQVKVDQTDKLKTYSWEIKNSKASRNEPYSGNPEDLFTSVQIAPNSFKYMGVSGSFTNWNELGAWISEKLLKGRNTIPDQTAAYIRELTRDINDPKLKAKKIYEYMQQKTRYISVQIGIGGFQPDKAEDVDKTSYGDCKGLANYTQGLLKVAGIDSYYAVIYGDDQKHSANPEFASMDQFNHVILCIPFKNDTTWVDCTSKENPFGYLGNFTDDRLALICTESGGRLIRTPNFSEDQSLQHRKAIFSMDAEGNLTGDMVTTFSGSQYDNRQHLVNEPLAEQLKMIPQLYSIDNIETGVYQLTQVKGSPPLTTEIFKLKARNYASKNGKELHIPLNRINRQPPVRELNNRLNLVYINRGYTDVDEITFALPVGYKVEMKPRNFTVETPFGTYSATLEFKDNALKYIRKMKLLAGKYPADKYQDLVNFYQSAADADNQKIVMVQE